MKELKTYFIHFSLLNSKLKFNFKQEMLQNRLDKFYSSLRKQGRMFSLLRFLTREISDLLLPFYFKLFTGNSKQLNSEEIFLVSLTTFPERISKIWLVIECMLRQDVMPSGIYLWLSKEQFSGERKDIPKRLLKYEKKGLLNIVFVDDDLRSHKKYYYILQQFPNEKVIVIDDDIYYPSTVIRDLKELNKKHPESIACLRAHRVIHENQNIIAPYKKWKKVFEGCGPTMDLFHTSGGGTLYMKKFFDEELFNKENFKKICFYADDVWLNVMAQKKETKTVKADYFSNLIPIKSNSFKLSKANVIEGGNDKQLRRVLDFYKIKESTLFYSK